jgi:hypothetical protein
VRNLIRFLERDLDLIRDGLSNGNVDWDLHRDLNRDGVRHRNGNLIRLGNRNCYGNSNRNLDRDIVRFWDSN